ncbi:MAG: family 10 glycosylhydrolase [Verrucomicrobiales bacterium]|nr:family 10 glycosylhydrolase [Verrucomicrobiales bacterium]
MTSRITKAVLIRVFLALGLLVSTRVEAGFAPSAEVPPSPPREFRGAWVATVNNIDWPSRPGLSVSQQQQELLNLLDQAATLRLNSIVFQVRPACDALYESKLEPWSEYLSGTMGQPPQPYYDPLAFIIREAHQRGLELHAWFNPFRARHHSGQGPLSPRHIARTKPQWVRSYGKYLWLDPAEPGVADYSLRVILDVVKRYDIDGVHLDDYFYPYREKDSKGRPLDFPDSPAWKRYQAQGGKLSRADWRRNHVNTFVKRLYDAVKAEKPHVKLGISPFGIWRPGYPASVDGLDSYEELFADSKKWWNQGWVDYLAPQLYWSIDAKQQSFPALLRWWTEQNTQRRHLWPGLNTANVGTRYQSSEILKQISLIRDVNAVDGEIHWSIKALLQNRQNLGDQLKSGPYTRKALVPSYPWLDRTPPTKPKVSVGTSSQGGLVLTWDPTGPKPISKWLVQVRQDGTWHTDVFPGGLRSCSFADNVMPDVLSVSAVDRCGNLSSPMVLENRSGFPAYVPPRIGPLPPRPTTSTTPPLRPATAPPQTRNASPAVSSDRSGKAGQR